MNKFKEIAAAWGDDELAELLEDAQGAFDYANADHEKETISFNYQWNDDGFECDCDVVCNFKTGIAKLSGDCSNEDIEAPQYLYGWQYSQEQEESFDPESTPEDFAGFLMDVVNDYFGNFSYFAQQDADEAENEDCSEYGDDEDED